MGVEYTYSYDLADYLSGSPEEEEQSKQEVTNSLLSKPVTPSSEPESTSDYDPLGFLDVFSNMAQATYSRASDVFKAYRPDRESVVNKVTTDYADEMERMAKESALLIAEQRKAGFDVIPEKYALSAAPEATTTVLGLDPAPEKQTSVENLMGEIYPDLDRPAKEPVSDMRDPFSRARASLMDRQGNTEGFRVAKDAVNADEVPSVGTSVADFEAEVVVEEPVVEATDTTEAAAGAGLMGPRSDTKGLTPITLTNKAQERLHELGFVEVGAADGAAGPSTRSAVRRYQEENELPVTGELDGVTLDSLTAASANLDKIMQRQITHHEGKKNYPYRDTRGYWTIGVGHLIGESGSDEDLANSGYSQYTRTNPMPESEVSELFQEDLDHHKEIAEGYDFYDDMSEEGKRAILDLTFNMGDFYNKKKPNGTYVWANLRRQIQAGNWEGAADNLASSAYARQVGQRAVTVTDLLRQAGD